MGRYPARVSNDNLTRIGPGVPIPRGQKPRRWFGIKPEFVIAAAVIIAMGMMITAVFVFNGASNQPAQSSSPNGAPTEVQVECSAVKHEYVLWKRTDEDFNLLASSKTRLVADMRMDSLSEAGKAFSKAAGGYKDQPSRALALSISQHNYDLSVVNLELVATNVINVENYEKAGTSRREVETKYESFLVLTCA